MDPFRSPRLIQDGRPYHVQSERPRNCHWELNHAAPYHVQQEEHQTRATKPRPLPPPEKCCALVVAPGISPLGRPLRDGPTRASAARLRCAFRCCHRFQVRYFEEDHFPLFSSFISSSTVSTTSSTSRANDPDGLGARVNSSIIYRRMKIKDVNNHVITSACRRDRNTFL